MIFSKSSIANNKNAKNLNFYFQPGNSPLSWKKETVHLDGFFVRRGLLHLQQLLNVNQLVSTEHPSARLVFLESIKFNGIFDFWWLPEDLEEIERLIT